MTCAPLRPTLPHSGGARTEGTQGVDCRDILSASLFYSMSHCPTKTIQTRMRSSNFLHTHEKYICIFQKWGADKEYRKSASFSLKGAIIGSDWQFKVGRKWPKSGAQIVAEAPKAPERIYEVGK